MKYIAQSFTREGGTTWRVGLVEYGEITAVFKPVALRPLTKAEAEKVAAFLNQYTGE